jgi:SAM-dependent methyltransferase
MLPTADLVQNHRVPRLPDLDRADRIAEFWGYPGESRLRRVLIDCEEGPRRVLLTLPSGQPRPLKPRILRIGSSSLWWLSCRSQRDRASGSKDMRSTDREELDRLLDEQRAYYSAVAEDYENQRLNLPGSDEVTQALDAFRPTGTILDLACGPGAWIGQLLRHASDVTALDASPEMLAIAAARVGRERVRFIQADLFTWKPDRRYDVVFMGFWLSHVPAERLESFWSFVGDCLKPGGRVFFVDDAYRTPDELVEDTSSSTIRRQLPDGTAYRLVKVPHRPADLERQLRQLGWDIKVTATAGPFYWGAGSLGERPT